MLRAVTAAPAGLVSTSRLGVGRVDGDQTRCAAGGLGQWVVMIWTFLSMPACPPKRALVRIDQQALDCLEAVGDHSGADRGAGEDGVCEVGAPA
jgi:hypothetical protein